ncbi:MAG: leucine-rich repeat domain-containing protein, partial [Clostridia bacterium]|nr:leucine-rich repeat domain-containing protein [Clostridia bacterium]
NLMRNDIEYGGNVFDGCESLSGDIGIVLGFYLGDESTEIPDDLFAGFKSLTGTITISNKITRIGNRAFKDCAKVEGIDISNATSLKEIGEEAFYGTTNLGKDEENRKLNFGDSLAVIGRRAFYQSGSGTGALLTNLILPLNLTSVGFQSFAYSGVYDVCFDCRSAVNGTTIFNTENITSPYSGDACYLFMQTKKMNNASFGANCQMTLLPANTFRGSSIVSITFPKTSDFTLIGSTALADCSLLTTIDLGNVKNINSYGFSNCRSLTDITWSDGLTGLGDYAFNGCSSLVSLPLNQSGNFINALTSIGMRSFAGCTNLGRTSTGDFKTDLVTLLQNSNITTIGIQAFNACDYLKGMLDENSALLANRNNTTIYVGAGAFLNSSGKSFVTFASVFAPYQKNNEDGTYKKDSNGNLIAVKTIGTEYQGKTDFMDLNGKPITDIEIPEGVETISASAFLNCTNITSVSLPSSLKSIGGQAFRGCSNLSIVTRNGDSMTILNSWVFGSTKVSSFDFTGITQIADHALCYAPIEKVDCSGLTYMAGGAFQFCSKLTSVKLSGPITSFTDVCQFNACGMLNDIDLSGCTSLTMLSNSMFAQDPLKGEIKLPSSIKSFGDNCFNSIGAVSFTMPSNLEKLRK